MGFKIDMPPTVRQLGLLVVFEGLDGTGKSYTLKYVMESLVREGLTVVDFREPSYGKYGTMLRSKFESGERFLPAEEASLFVIDRLFNLEYNILPSLEKNAIVLLDRYFYSSIAYQGASGLDPKMVLDLNRPVIINPDTVIIFDNDVDISLSRISKNRNTTTSMEKKEYLLKVQEIYRSMEALNIQIVDSSVDLVDLQNTVLALVKKALDKKNDIHKAFNSWCRAALSQSVNLDDEACGKLWQCAVEEVNNRKND